MLGRVRHARKGGKWNKNTMGALSKILKEYSDLQLYKKFNREVQTFPSQSRIRFIYRSIYIVLEWLILLCVLGVAHSCGGCC